MKLSIVLFMFCVSTALSQSKDSANSHPKDSMIVLSFEKVIARMKAWQARIDQIDKIFDGLTTEKKQLQGAVGASQVFLTDSTFALKKKKIQTK